RRPAAQPVAVDPVPSSGTRPSRARDTPTTPDRGGGGSGLFLRRDSFRPRLPRRVRAQPPRVPTGSPARVDRRITHALLAARSGPADRAGERRTLRLPSDLHHSEL